MLNATKNKKTEGKYSPDASGLPEKNVIQKLKTYLLIMLCMITFTSNAQLFTNRTAWENALNALPTTNADFTGVPASNDLCIAPVVAGTHTFTAFAGCGGGQTLSVNNSGTPQVFFSGTTGGTPNVRVTVPTSYGIGFDWQTSATSTGAHNSLYVNVGSTTLLLNPSTTSGFFGYINCAPVTYYNLYTTLANFQQFYASGFSCSTAPFLFTPATTPTVSTSSTLNCGTVSTTLNITSGTLNDATAWKWYSASCGGTLVGTGTSIAVSPTATTTYYARGEGACPGTYGLCADVTVTVISAAISGTTTICQGDAANLSIACAGGGPYSGTLSDGTAWSGSTSPVSVSVSPTANTTYSIASFIANGNICTSTIAGSATVTVAGQAPVTTGGSTTGPGTVNLSATGSGTLDWYDAPTGGTLVNTGSSYSPFITATTNYYVSNFESTTANYSIGIPSSVSPFNISSTVGLVFNVSLNATLNTVTIYPTTIGTGNILLQTSVGVNITSVPYTIVAADIGTAKVITLNFSLTPGAYRLIKSGTGLWRRDVSGVSYPYTAPGSPIAITGPSTGLPSNYFYFYNWQVTSNGVSCTSARTIVTATYVNPNITWYLDADNDGWYANSQVAATSPGAGWTDTQPANGSGDCDDNNNTVYPGATEILCNNIDENCNGMADDGVQSTPPTSTTSDAAINEICLGGSVNLSVNGGSLGTGAIWKWYTGSCNGTLMGTGAVLNVSPTSTTSYYVKADGTCNTTTCVQINITVRTVPPASSVVVPPIINLPAHGCSGTFVTNINVSNVPTASYYIWDGPAGTTFNGGANPYITQSPSTDITFGAPSGSGYYIGVQAANSCGVSVRKTQWVRNSVGVPASVNPGVAGLTTYCPNSSATFSCTLVTGATDYGWTITGDATLTPTGNSVTVNFGPTWSTGTLCVVALTPCFSSASKCLALGTASVTAYMPTGNFTSCPNGTETYSVPAQSGIASYSWTLPPNATGSSSTNAITVNFGSGFTGGDICVQATSLCGVALTQKCKSINSNVPTIVSSIAGPISGLCSQTIVYTCPAQSGVTFNWTVPTTATLNSGQGTNAISTTFGTFVTETVCVTASNSCGTSVPRCITVKGKPVPPASITAIPSSWCANTLGVEFVADVSNITGSYTLSWIYPNSSVANYVLGGGNSTSLILNWVTGSGPVHVTASNACGNCTRTSTQGNSCREGEVNQFTESNLQLAVYPNPANEIVTVEFFTEKQSNTLLSVADVSGRTILSQNVNIVEGLNKTQVDLSKVSKGIYMLHVNSTEETRKIKIVVE